MTLAAVVVFLFANHAQALGNDSSHGDSQFRKVGAGLSLVDVDLPLEFKARVGGLFTRYRHAIDGLAYHRWLSPGPAIQRDSLIESRISIGRKIWRGVELEVAWATQSPFSLRSLSMPERQTIGAFIRLTR
jgi:hypothetical protein